MSGGGMTMDFDQGRTYFTGLFQSPATIQAQAVEMKSPQSFFWWDFILGGDAKYCISSRSMSITLKFYSPWLLSLQ
jgi:hypothetical protein